MATAFWNETSRSEHFVQFCETDAFLVKSISQFIGAGLMDGMAGIVLATQAHREGLEEQLKEEGLDVAAARTRGQYIAMDVAATLSKIMVDGMPEPGRFAELIGSIIERAAKGGRQVRIFGELVALLWAEGNRAAAIRLEELWNDLAREHSFSLFCAYPMQGFGREVYGVEFGEICKQHSQVIPGESYTELTDEDERLRAITLLQQKASALEAEVAERKRVEEALRESDARKDEFISMASHELKTPVTSLMGFTQILQSRLKKQADEESLRYLAIMNKQLIKLTRLINELLDISSIQQGNVVYQKEPFDADALVQEVMENLQAGTSSHRLLIEGRTEARVWGDRDRIGEVLTNLVTNAIKYSPAADTVLVRISKDRQNVVVSVRDFGIGIAATHHERIFERFYQVSDPEIKTFPGLGIGLYISNEIIKRHHGRRQVESEKGAGSTFSFALPFSPEH